VSVSVSASVTSKSTEAPPVALSGSRTSTCTRDASGERLAEQRVWPSSSGIRPAHTSSPPMAQVTRSELGPWFASETRPSNVVSTPTSSRPRRSPHRRPRARVSTPPGLSCPPHLSACAHYTRWRQPPSTRPHDSSSLPLGLDTLAPKREGHRRLPMALESRWRPGARAV
jgi:hypothetical protein